jgi:hypothetical protein
LEEKEAPKRKKGGKVLFLNLSSNFASFPFSFGGVVFFFSLFFWQGKTGWGSGRGYLSFLLLHHLVPTFITLKGKVGDDVEEKERNPAEGPEGAVLEHRFTF